MKFHPKGSVSLNATLIPVGAIPGQTEAVFQVSADPENGVVAGYYLASEFLANYTPGAATGKSSAASVAERLAVEDIIASL
jgi:hypothetical protein